MVVKRISSFFWPKVDRCPFKCFEAVQGEIRITHNPYYLQYGGSKMHVDSGAEKLVAAEKEGRKIAVETKGFGGPSKVAELDKAVGQFTLYRFILEEREPDYGSLSCSPSQKMC